MADEVFIDSISQQTFEQNQKFLADLDGMIKKVTTLNNDMKKAKWPSQNKKVIQEANAELQKSVKFTIASEKVQREFLKTQQEQEKVKQQSIKTSSEKVKVQQQELKNQQEQEKITQQSTKSIQEQEKVKQQALRTSKEESRLRTQEIREQQSQIRLEEQQRRAKEKKAQAIKKSVFEIQAERVETQRANKEARESAILSNSLVGAYQKLNLRRTQAKRTLQDLMASGTASNKVIRQAQLEYDKLDKRVKKADLAVRDFSKNVGNYPARLGLGINSLRQFASAFGFTSGIFLFAQAVREATNIIREFESSNAKLAAILQVERSEMTALTQNAKDLGAITARSATEVVKLQIAYARLGFTQQEILDLTEGTIAGSIALNANLDETATLVGALVRTFDDLSTSDADEILDILSLSTAQSALNFEKLQTALPIVAGAANAAGIPFVKLVALLGKLSDAGIDASMSATALRNIFIESAAQGLSYDQILDKIANSSDKLTAANDEFGKRAAVSATVLSNTIKETNELDQALQNAAGTAQEMADKELRTLNGRITLLKSAWEGLILAVEDGEGSMSNAIKRDVDITTNWLNNLSFELNNNLSVWDRWKLQLNSLTADSEYEGWFSDSIKILKEDAKARKDSVAEIDAQNAAFIKLNGSLAPLLQNQQALTGVQIPFISQDGKKEREDGVRLLSDINAELKIEQDLLKAGQFSTREEAKLMQDRIEALKKEKAAILGSNSTKKETETILKNTIAWYEKLISSLESERERLARNSREYETYTKLIEDAQKELNKFRIEIDGVNAGLEKGAVGIKAYRDALESMEDSLKGGEIEGIETGGIDDLERQVEVAKDGEAAVKRLREETDRFIESFQTDFFQEGGLASLQMFFDGTFDKMLAGAEGFGEKFAVVFDSIAEVGQEAFNLIAQASNKQFETAISNAQKERDIALMFAGDSATAREAIETEYDEKVREIRNEQAEAQKKQAIFNSVINTAQAVVAALAVGPPQGIVLAAIVGALGLAQTALIASTPVPQFKDGVRDFEGGYAMLNDRKGSQYREVVTTPDGQVMRPVGRNVMMNLPKGSNVYRSETEFHKELNGILGDNQINPLGVGPRLPEIMINSSSDIDYDRIAEIMVSTVGGIKSYHTDINKRGITTYTQSAHGKNVRMNNRTIMK